MGPQNQDLYVARGGSPTSILSTYIVSHTGVRHGASLRVGECPDLAGFNTPPPKIESVSGEAQRNGPPAGNP